MILEVVIGIVLWYVLKWLERVLFLQMVQVAVEKTKTKLEKKGENDGKS